MDGAPTPMAMWGAVDCIEAATKQKPPTVAKSVRARILVLFSVQLRIEKIMQIVNFSDARNNLKGLIDRVVDDADYTVIARRDAPNAVIVSQEYFDSMMETIHLLKVPANAAHLQKSIAQHRQGKAKVRALVADK